MAAFRGWLYDEHKVIRDWFAALEASCVCVASKAMK